MSRGEESDPADVEGPSSDEDVSSEYQDSNEHAPSARDREETSGDGDSHMQDDNETSVDPRELGRTGPAARPENDESRPLKRKRGRPRKCEKSERSKKGPSKPRAELKSSKTILNTNAKFRDRKRMSVLKHDKIVPMPKPEMVLDREMPRDDEPATAHRVRTDIMRALEPSRFAPTTQRDHFVAVKAIVKGRGQSKYMLLDDYINPSALHFRDREIYLVSTEAADHKLDDVADLLETTEGIPILMVRDSSASKLDIRPSALVGVLQTLLLAKPVQIKAWEDHPESDVWSGPAHATALRDAQKIFDVLQGDGRGRYPRRLDGIPSYYPPGVLCSAAPAGAQKASLLFRIRRELEGDVRGAGAPDDVATLTVAEPGSIKSFASDDRLDCWRWITVTHDDEGRPARVVVLFTPPGLAYQERATMALDEYGTSDLPRNVPPLKRILSVELASDRIM